MNKMAPMAGAIRKCSNVINYNTKKLLYRTFIEPHFRYMTICWGDAPKANILRLQRIQNKVIK